MKITCHKGNSFRVDISASFQNNTFTVYKVFNCCFSLILKNYSFLGYTLIHKSVFDCLSLAEGLSRMSFTACGYCYGVGIIFEEIRRRIGALDPRFRTVIKIDTDYTAN